MRGITALLSLPAFGACALFLSACSPGAGGSRYDACTTRGDQTADFFGPGAHTSPYESIDSDGTVTSALPGDRFVIEVDFTAHSPEEGVGTFSLPGWVGDTTDLAAGDEVHVDYTWGSSAWWPSGELAIARGGETLVYGFSDFFAPESFAVGALNFSLSEAGCEPALLGAYEDCYEWIRMQYAVSCPDLVEPMTVLDGTEATMQCGPGYRVAAQDLVRRGRALAGCTDVPPEMVHVVVARVAE